MGAKVSVETTGMSAEARTMAGSTKWPGRSSTRPPHSSVPPWDFAGAMAVSIAPDGSRVDQRSHQGAGIERIADAHLPVRGDQASLELFGARAMHEHPASRGAALSRGAHGAEYDGRDREIEVGALVHDDGVVAAELQEALAEPFGHASRRPGVRHGSSR